MTYLQRVARGVCLSVAMLLTRHGRAEAQIIDARLIPAGTLRVSFTPEYQSWDRMFDQNGDVIPLGKYLSSDSAGWNLFPSLAAPEAAVRAITGNPNYRLSLGSVLTRVDADVRRFPFEFSVGLLRSLTLTATLPIVVTRVNAAIAVDSTSGNAGWNQAAAFESGNPAGPSRIMQLVSQLESSATAIESRIATGGSCPGSPSCAELLARTRALESALVALSGVSPTGLAPVLPPAVPTAGSPEGSAITDVISRLSADLSSAGVLGAPLVAMPLPSKRFTPTDIQSLLGSTSFGYEATIPAYSKRPHLGDIELGAHWGIVRRPKVRFMATGVVRLPTAATDSPDNLVDIGTGDRQTDFVAGMEAALDPGPVSLTLAGSYNWQQPGILARRITPPNQPIALASATSVLTRDPGNALWLAAFPAIRLAEGFRIYGSASYSRKAADRYSGGPAGASTPLLEQQTAMRSLSLGGGIAYRVLARGGRLPIEAGVSYQTALSGSGGFTPRATVLTMYLRTYYRLWGEVQAMP
ncbi:MAG: hypothetical protein HY700_14975 [Gemmatimonadetes bacterium]|nr:hypothetical protein [Gemmatimonadota bacterium]